MVDQRVIDYIKKSRELGHNDSDIKNSLLNAGHKEEDVRAAFDAADGKSSLQGENLMPPPLPLSGLHSITHNFGDENESLPQTKSNFWVAATILANIFIVSVVVVFGLFVLGLMLSNSQTYLLIVSVAGGVVGFAIIGIFASWLGVRSARKKTAINPKNYLRVTIYTILLPLLLSIGLIIWGMALGKLNWWVITSYIISPIFSAVLIYYFLSRNRKLKYIVIVIIFIYLVSVVLQGYGNYKNTIVALQEIQSHKQLAESIPNGGTKVSTVTVYTNNKMNYKITIPAGWYISEPDDLGYVYFYDCPFTQCDVSMEIGFGSVGLSSQSEAIASQISLLQSRTQSGMNASYQEMDKLIPGARVLKGVSKQTSLWTYRYTIIWPYTYYLEGVPTDSNFTLSIVASNDKAVETLFPSLAIYGKPK